MLSIYDSDRCYLYIDKSLLKAEGKGSASRFDHFDCPIREVLINVRSNKSYFITDLLQMFVKMFW